MLATRTSTLNAAARKRLVIMFGAAAMMLNTLAMMPAAARTLGETFSPVIVRGAAGSHAAVVDAVRASGGRVTMDLSIIDGVAAVVPARALPTLAATPGIREVSPNGRLHLLTSSYDPGADMGSQYNTSLMTGAQSMWKAGYTGKGVDVALIDSGVVPVAGLDTPGKILNGPDISFDSQSANLAHLDAFGHGTFMAGIIGGRDASATGNYAGQPANFVGVAPDSRILSVKVADSNGVTDVSQVIAAIAWVIQHRQDAGLNVRVLNLSFGTDSNQPYTLDPLAYAAERAWKSGIVVVASAGNSGWTSGGLVDPANDPYLVAVGAVDPHGSASPANHTVATFSQSGNGLRNPDLVAPGKSMQSLRDPGSYIDVNYGSTGRIDDRFFRGSGTSEAAAVVSGAAALLIQQRPYASPDQIKSLLMSTATSLPGASAASQGAGELNLSRASAAWTPIALQAWVPATGLGSLEGARGSVHVSMGGVSLTGERDIFGALVSTQNLASAIINNNAWTGGIFNGNGWTGNGWDSSTWTSSTWTSSTWTSSTWTSSTWTSSTWTSSTWTSSTWTSSTWTSSTWTSSTWTSSTWS